MDASRSDLEFMAEVLQIALDEGATTINVPDTVGYSMPRRVRARCWSELYRLVPGLAERDHVGALPRRPRPGRGQLLRRAAGGLPPGGVRHQRHRRAGGQRLARGDRDAARTSASPAHGFWTGASTDGDRQHQPPGLAHDRLPGAAQQGDRGPQRVRARGRASTRTACSRSAPPTRSWTPPTIGLDSNSIVLGKHSGRHALRNALEELGFHVDGAALNTAFKRFKEVADRKKKVTALDLEAIVSDEMRQSADAYTLESLRHRGRVRPRAVRHGQGRAARRRHGRGQLHRRRPGRGVLQRAQRGHRPRGAAEGVPRARRHGRARRARRGHRAGRARRRRGHRARACHRTPWRPPAARTCGR